MILRYIFFGVLAFLLLLLVIPVGVGIRYCADGPTVKLLVGHIHLRLYPRRRKGEKSRKRIKKQPKEQASAPTEPGAEKRGGKLSALKPYIPLTLELLNGIRLRLLARKLTLLVNLGGDDPCDLALLYGKVNGALGSAIPLLENAFRIRKREIQAFCDFTAEDTEVYLELEIVACPARMLGLLLRYGWKFLEVFWKQKSNKAV